MYRHLQYFSVSGIINSRIYRTKIFQVTFDVNQYIQYIYTEGSVKIFKAVNSSLQLKRLPTFAIVLIALFCDIRSLCNLEDAPHASIP
ncbi:unnamed protein product [Acanthoscelides obtectus]|uniref:Uncharacterized protein n=1 Tax=Acanthoscelides obtectus TaxID=200917 RepID=A0A9P0JZF7_ACAOB|nr:unnamed protein product [Acanthoscelides obtectus]CAK1669598.1 hypothetical protein AOBTE_LOCUS27100 [Acanthoscelides obtectus]